MKLTEWQVEQIEKIYENCIESDSYMTDAEDAITEVLCVLGIKYQYDAGKIVIDLNEDDAE